MNEIAALILLLTHIVTFVLGIYVGVTAAKKKREEVK